MPTGYTYPVVEGKITEFSDFALSCARAFGALIHMRDSSLETPIPREIKPDTSFYDKSIAKAQKRVREIKEMTNAQADAVASAEHAKALKAQSEYLLAKEVEAARLNAMIAKVRAWVPPTQDHSELKKFMLDQLTMSLPGEYAPAIPEQLDGSEWRRREIKRLMESITYDQGEREKEIERAASRNEWLRALRASLKPQSKAA